MDKTRIKICGIRDVETALASVDAGADAIGLVFVQQSPRHVGVDLASTIVEALPSRAHAVGLFVDRAPHEIRHIASRTGLSIVQLHGHERLSILDQLDGLTVWKALPFGPGLMEEARPWDDDPRVDALLIDAPPKDGLTGGSGQAFDWSALAKVVDQFTTPIILAGGLGPGNVGQAIRTLRPMGVDVSSGVESSRGVKDVAMVRAFCQAVRQADSNTK